MIGLKIMYAVYRKNLLIMPYSFVFKKCTENLIIISNNFPSQDKTRGPI